MNFGFSAEQEALRDQVRRLLDDTCPLSRVRAGMDSGAPFDGELWQQIADMGLLGISIPEQHGGLGLGYLELCVVAEELGRSVAPVPFSSTSYLAAEFLLRAGSPAQQAQWLPGIADGSVIGSVAFAETLGALVPSSIASTVSENRLSGVKPAVADGMAAGFLVVLARDRGGLSLYLVDAAGSGCAREAVETIDPSRGHARLRFDRAPMELLGIAGDGWNIVEQVMDRAAILFAFEQVGGAEAALAMACDYARTRMAFGRPIGSFQAIKHMLADMYVSVTLAKSNAYYGAWALATDAPELDRAAATARISATRAYRQCAKNNIQVHGGIGATWEGDCHLHYRRSNLLAVNIGDAQTWEGRLIEHLLTEGQG